MEIWSFGIAQTPFLLRIHHGRVTRGGFVVTLNHNQIVATNLHLLYIAVIKGNCRCTRNARGYEFYRSFLPVVLSTQKGSYHIVQG